MMKKVIPLILYIVLFTSCYDNIDNTPDDPTVIVEIPSVTINTQVTGKVFETDRSLISNYSISVGGQTRMIENDFFYFPVENVEKRGETFMVEYEGQIRGIKTELLIENDINYFKLYMHPVIERLSLNTLNEPLFINDHISIDISNVFGDDKINGEEELRFTNIQEHIQLTEVAFDAFGDVLSIESLGGFYVSINDTNGNIIALSNAHQIDVTFRTLPEGVNSLLRFDEATRKWIKHSKISSSSTVAIPASGYYSLVKEDKGVFTEGIVSLENDSPVSYQNITWESNGIKNDNHSTEKGRWIACMPEMQDVEIHLLTPCGEAINTTNISTTNTESQNESLVITNTNNVVNFENIVFDCNGELIDQAGLSVESTFGSEEYIFIDNEVKNVTVCNDATIAAIDINTGNQGPSISASADLPEIMTNCEELHDGYSYLMIRDDVQIYEAFTMIEQNNKIRLSSENEEIILLIDGNELVGSFEENEINISILDEGFGDKGYAISCLNSDVGCGIHQFVVEDIEDDKLIISMKGELWMQTISPPVAGFFEVEGLFILTL